MAGKHHHPAIYDGTDAERIAFSTGDLTAGSLWIQTSGDEGDPGAYVWTGSEWKRITMALSNDNVSDPPTDAEIDGAFGTPASVGDGFLGIIDDNGDGTAVWLVIAKNAAWWWGSAVKAV